MDIHEVMEFIGQYTKGGRPVTNLSRFRELMHRLGDPQNRLEFIHVAGTNGKGSTVRMLSEIFQAAGYRTGEFVSPFIYRYNDRIMIDGEEISDEHLCELAEQVIPVIRETGESGYSQFEITTAFAFMYFAAMKCEIVILETGLGGLLDCTNIIEPPVCSVITSISLDHTAILGDTVEAIARHKAGIIKNGSPCILQSGNPAGAVDVIEMKAITESSQLIVPDERRLRVLSSDITGSSFFYKERLYKVSMAGEHQIKNALTAIEAAKEAARQGFLISRKDIYNGVFKAAVPSRCQVIQESGPMIIIDGAHNPDGMRTLSEVVKKIRCRPKVMVCGMLDNKDWEHSLDYITPYIDKAYCVDGFFRNAVFAPTVAERFSNGEAASLRDAYTKACIYAGEKGVVVIGGSLYLAAALQKYGNNG